MKSLAFPALAVLCLAALSSGQLDTAALSDNQWVDKSPLDLTLPINGSNWMYEGDLKSHPFYGFFIMGPGHVIHPQDCNYYPHDPVKNKWMKLDPSTFSPRMCLTSFAVSSQDSLILRFGNSEGAHQKSQGGFAADYRSVNPEGGRGSALWAYPFSLNKWFSLRNFSASQLGCNMCFPQYDFEHDVFVKPDMIYSYHTDACVPLTPPAGIHGGYVSSAVDTRRGVVYAISGGGLYRLDLETRAWSLAPGAPPRHPDGCNNGNFLGVNLMAYDSRHDVLIFINDSGYVSTNCDWVSGGVFRVRTWAYDCAAGSWSEMAPSPCPLDLGFMAYNEALNVFQLMGGTSGGSMCRGGGTKGTWYYRYKRGKGVLDSIVSAPAAGLAKTGGGALVYWNRVGEAGVTGYNVYRGQGDPYPSHFTRLNPAPVTDTFYSDATCLDNTAYSYRVCAVKGALEGRLSRHLYTRPSRVLAVMASVEDTHTVRVSWNPSPSFAVTGYNVYRASGAGIYTSASYQKLNNTPVTGLEYTDAVDLSDGVARGYIVRAVSAFGLESAPSQECTTFPDLCERVYSIPVAGAFRLGWNPPVRTRVLGVNLYRILGTKLNTAGLITDSVTSGWPLPPSTGGDGYSLMGQTYQVRAVNVLGQEGFCTGQISPSNTEYGVGIALPYQRFDYSQYVASEKGDGPVPGDAAAAAGAPLIFPNPFNPSVTITIGRDRVKGMTLKIYSLSGRLVADLTDGISSGRVVWNAAGNASGVYAAVAQKGMLRTTKKIVYSK